MAARIPLDDLRPLVAKLRGMQRHCRPFGADYHAISVSLEALEEMARHFGGRAGFFGSEGDACGPDQADGRLLEADHHSRVKRVVTAAE